MRVISGKYKGKSLKGFDIDGTRPTMDRVKESLFASIQSYLPNSIVLDLFAGSGSLGIEALSNGAKFCYFVDNSSKINSILKENLVGITNTYQFNGDFKEALFYFKNNNIKFDIIFLDPPYRDNLIQDSINLIEEYGLIKENGLIVCEYEKELFNCNYGKIIKDKKYGHKCVKIYCYK